MPRTPDGKWIDKQGKQILLHDCIHALHSAITRLTWEINFGEKTLENPRLKAAYSRDIEVLEVIRDSFANTQRQFVEDQKKKKIKLTIPGNGGK